jgi:hypothetical protein
MTSTARCPATIPDPDRVATIRRWLGALADKLDPLLALYKPYIEERDTLPTDGRSLLVGNHTYALLRAPVIRRRHRGPVASPGLAEPSK